MKYLKGIAGVAILVILDQITKFWARTVLINKDIIVADGIFRFHYLENTGAAFGIFKDKVFIFVLLTLIVLAFIGFYYGRLPQGKRYLPLHVLFIMLFSGAMGNLIDRIFHGYVVDFMYFELIDFPVFNLADCYVTFSALFLIVLFLFFYKEEEQQWLRIGKKKA